MRRALFVIGCLLVIGLGAGLEAPEVKADNCEGCVEWDGPTPGNGWSQQASCCREGPESWSECSLYMSYEGATKELSLSGDCWIGITEDGYECRGGSYNCADFDWGPGGGDGNNNCYVQSGTLCPAECFSCTYWYY